jgi:hypothetical protein
MSTLVMALLVVQVVVGGYLFSQVAQAGSRHSTARASRLPRRTRRGEADPGIDPLGHGLGAALLIGCVLAVGLGF